MGVTPVNTATRLGYRISIRGGAPPDLNRRVSELHAVAIAQRKGSNSDDSDSPDQHLIAPGQSVGNDSTL